MSRRPVIIRDVEVSDAEALQEIWLDFATEPDRPGSPTASVDQIRRAIGRLRTEAAERLLVAVVGDAPVGVAHLAPRSALSDSRRGSGARRLPARLERTPSAGYRQAASRRRGRVGGGAGVDSYHRVGRRDRPRRQPLLGPPRPRSGGGGQGLDGGPPTQPAAGGRGQVVGEQRGRCPPLDARLASAVLGHGTRAQGVVSARSLTASARFGTMLQVMRAVQTRRPRSSLIAIS